MKKETGLQWYLRIERFLSSNDCYLIRTNDKMCTLLCGEERASIVRVNANNKRYGLYVSRGNKGNSFLVSKDFFDKYCKANNIDKSSLFIISYSVNDFRECHHAKNISKAESKQQSEKRKQIKRISILNSAFSTKEEKINVRLDIWSEKKLKNNEVVTTSYEDSLYRKLYRKYKKRIKRQERIIINQHVYFVDLYMRAYKVAIEVDGGYHKTNIQQKKDKERDNNLAVLGLLTIRIKNEEINKKYDALVRLLEKRHKDIINGINVQTGTFHI